MTAPVIPTSADELEEMLLDRKKMTDLLGQPKAFGEFITNYARNQMDKDQGIATQVREETQRVLAEFLKTQKSNVPLNFNPMDQTPNYYQARKNGLYNKNAVGAKVEGHFTSHADMLRAVSPQAKSFKNGKDLLERLEKVQEIQNAFGTNVPSDGGFLIPETLRSDLLQTALESAIVRPRATVIPVETQRTAIPTVDATSNVSSVYGGIVCYWLDEGTAPTESSAKFGQVVLDTKKLAAYVTAPNELVADATAFGAFLDQALPKAMAFEEDYRFMQGAGVGEPLGFISCPASVAVTAQSGQGANTIVVENLANMFARMLPTSLNNAVWIASIDTFPQLATMALSVGTGGAPVWLANGSVAGAPPMSIYGRPVYFTEKAAPLGTTGDINFVDLSFYLVGDRQAVTASSSTDFLFSTDKTAYKIIERVDGRPWLQSAITPKNNSSSTLTPFVQLSSTRT